MFDYIFFSKLVGTHYLIDGCSYYIVSSIWLVIATVFAIISGLFTLLNIFQPGSFKSFVFFLLMILFMTETENKNVIVKSGNEDDTKKELINTVYKNQGYKTVLKLQPDFMPLNKKDLQVLLDKKTKTYTDVSIIAHIYSVGLSDVPKNAILAKQYSDMVLATELREASSGNTKFLMTILDRIDLTKNSAEEMSKDLIYSKTISEFLKHKKLNCDEADSLYTFLQDKRSLLSFPAYKSLNSDKKFVKTYNDRFNLIFAPLQPALDKYTYSECIPVYNKYH